MRRLAITFLLLSCGGVGKELPPQGQAVLYFDTDAPLPGATVLPLFDRLRVDVAACDEPARCAPVTRDFVVTEEMLRARKVSIGVVPSAAGDRPFVRARLFLFAESFDTEPTPDVTIDVNAVLPPIPAEGVVEHTLFLPTDLVGQPSARVELMNGAPASSAVSTWPGAQPVDCSEAPRPGEVCVPGGAFFLGSARLRDFRVFLDPAPEARRLVVMSPFFIDAHEVTVAAIRAARTPATPKLESDGELKPEHWCTFTASASKNDPLPANCVRLVDAAAHCTARGAQLPSEAQFEYVASNRGRSLWPHGDDVPTCTDAVLARAYVLENFADSSGCRSSKVVDGPLPAQSGARDRVDLPTGAVFDLVGNLSEYTRDIFQHRHDVCWSARRVYYDPECDRNGATRPRGYLVKGGNFWWHPGFSFAAMRFAIEKNDVPDPLWGFRCARKSL